MQTREQEFKFSRKKKTYKFSGSASQDCLLQVINLHKTLGWNFKFGIKADSVNNRGRPDSISQTFATRNLSS